MRRCLLVCVLFLNLSLAFAQQVTISGTVTGSDNTPVEGVSVKVKGSQTAGAITDAEGKYRITISSRDAFLIFSHVGYLDRELSPGKSSTLDVVLQSKIKESDEVVVVGYGTVRKKDLTGSVAKVNMEDINKAPVRSFDEALAGRTSGVQVQSSDGQPGSGISIVVRGNNSITQDNSPLYVVDGFPIENANNNAINPADIETIEVLKDASATAIYGARGANGVIIITTKKGKEGPPVISLNVSYGTQKALRKMDLLSAYEYVRYQLESDPALTPAAGSFGLTPTQIYLANGKSIEDYKNEKAFDWQDAVLRQAPMANYNLAIIGGTKQTRYAISGSYLDQQGILINSGYKRYQGRIVLDQTINSKLKIGINANYSNLLQSGISPSQSVFSASHNLMVAIWGARPVSPDVDDPDDVLFDPTINSANDYRVNPVVNQKNLVRNNRLQNFTVNAYAEYTIMSNLKLRISGGVVQNIGENQVFNNSQTQYGNPRALDGVNGSIAFPKNSSWLNENTLNWNKSFGKSHTLNAVAGFTAQAGKSSSYGMRATQLPNEELGLSGLDEGILQPISATSSLWSMASYLGRVNYSYKSKYLFTASFRSDGSSKFSANNKWSYFPSGAFSWRFSKENFLVNSKILSEGKFRISYGQTGNNRVSDFAYLTLMRLTNPLYVFDNNYQPGVEAVQLGNNDLRWENTRQIDMGIDLGFFDQRLNITADVYEKTTPDLLLNANLPTSTGFTTVFKNVGSVRNQGLEFSVNSVNIQKAKFSWSSSFNISFNKSEVLKLAEDQEALLSNINWDQNWRNTPAYIAKLGMPLGMMYGFIWDGVYTYDDFNRTGTGGYILKDNVTTNGNNRDRIQPGDIKYRDLNGDKVINANDYTVIGRGLPIHYGGFTNNFTYGDFDLNIFFQWSYGNDIMNTNLVYFGANESHSSRNLFAFYKDRWTPENPDSNIPRLKGFRGGGYSSYMVEDGSYLRLKTVSLGYNVNSRLLSKVKIRSLRAYVSAQNLITWTNYTGLDPEVSAYNSALTPGFDFSTYPRARTITFGLNLSF